MNSWLYLWSPDAWICVLCTQCSIKFKLASAWRANIPKKKDQRTYLPEPNFWTNSMQIKLFNVVETFKFINFILISKFIWCTVHTNWKLSSQSPILCACIEMRIFTFVQLLNSSINYHFDRMCAQRKYCIPLTHKTIYCAQYGFKFKIHAYFGRCILVVRHYHKSSIQSQADREQS